MGESGGKFWMTERILEEYREWFEMNKPGSHQNLCSKHVKGNKRMIGIERRKNI